MARKYTAEVGRALGWDLASTAGGHGKTHQLMSAKGTFPAKFTLKAGRNMRRASSVNGRNCVRTPLGGVGVCSNHPYQTSCKQDNRERVVRIGRLLLEGGSPV
jgi:hypothetical protein